MAVCVLPKKIKSNNSSPSIAAAISGTGNSTYCYVLYNGTKYYSAGSVFQVTPGETITFYVYGKSSSYPGWVEINGSTVLTVTNSSTQNYTWTVPSGTNSINIMLSYYSTSSKRRGQITVTTA